MAVPEWLRGDESVVYVHHRPAAPGDRAEWPLWLPGEVVSSVVAAGVDKPWRHQREVADLAFAGNHVAVSTGTASGKSLAYLLPVMAATAVADGVVGHLPDTVRTRLGARGHTALYLAPTKALAHDQVRAARALGPAGWRISALDGDSDDAERRFARDFATYVLTNPDMLHRSVLPNHARWSRFLGSLRYVVIDEAHRYRGVFGAHVAAVVRRLRRLCAQYGADPVFLLASATSANAGESGGRLIGEPAVAVVDLDTSSRAARDVVLWRPAESLTRDTARITAALVDSARQTITFVPSRKQAELTAVAAQDLVTTAREVASYRSGYLAADRREIERNLSSGALAGVVATNALELGIDISGMDAVVIAGFPGTLAAMWQQAGRAGRGSRDALVVLEAREDPLDVYLFDHPELVFDRPVEQTVLHPDNPHVLGPHLAAAAQEAHLTPADARWFGPTMEPILDRLVHQGLLRHRPTGWFWTRPERAVDAIDLRSLGGRPLDIIDRDSGRVLGQVDRSAADRTVHPGAVYLHLGDQWLVDDLRADENHALVHAARPGYYTQPRSLDDVHILREVDRRPFGAGFVCRGEVELASQVVGYLRRDEITHDVWDQTPLDLPVRTLRTQAMWWLVPDAVIADLALTQVQLASAAHGAEHTAIGLLPVFAPCDRWDIGGLSTALHPDTGQCTIIVHDGHPGGAGFAYRGFEVAEAWARATLQLLESCPCNDGCPACVVSPKCGNANQMLSKPHAARLLAALLAEPPAPGPAPTASAAGAVPTMPAASPPTAPLASPPSQAPALG
ncbi:MAG TPA: DEAD/DEAH box helicase [Propionibacteriaceae bacterium]|nr:DEAD/DEAH box helicase [Propionibacteriaceae bacterium]